jgi:hypothetical protein
LVVARTANLLREFGVGNGQTDFVEIVATQNLFGLLFSNVLRELELISYWGIKSEDLALIPSVLSRPLERSMIYQPNPEFPPSSRFLISQVDPLMRAHYNLILNYTLSREDELLGALNGRAPMIREFDDSRRRFAPKTRTNTKRLSRTSEGKIAIVRDISTAVLSGMNVSGPILSSAGVAGPSVSGGASNVSTGGDSLVLNGLETARGLGESVQSGDVINAACASTSSVGQGNGGGGMSGGEDSGIGSVGIVNAE